MGLHGSGGFFGRYANTGRKRIQCPYCGRKFYAGSRNRHSVEPDGSVFCPYRCWKCGKVSKSWYEEYRCEHCRYDHIKELEEVTA